VALDGAARSAGMEVGAAAPDFFGDLGERCGHKGGTTHGSGDSVWVSTSSTRGAGGGGGARRDLQSLCWEPAGISVGACQSA
jgi:hypothetical protein